LTTGESISASQLEHVLDGFRLRNEIDWRKLGAKNLGYRFKTLVPSDSLVPRRKYLISDLPVSDCSKGKI